MVKSIRRLLSLTLIMLLALPLLPAMPAGAAYGVLFIPQSVYELELPSPNNLGPGIEKLDFDPFLGGMEGSRSWIHWDTSTILTECGGLMDLSYVCAVESEYPEGNYIVRCVAFYRNDAEKSLVSYHITYQTDETEFYEISYFGHHYKEAMLAMSRASLSKKENEQAQAAGIPTATAVQTKVEDLFTGQYDGTDGRIPNSKNRQVEIYKYNSTSKEYEEIKHDPADPSALPADLTNSSVTKYYKTASWFTPTPDTIYAGRYMNGDILLRNGSGKYLGTASWFEWDEDSGKVTMSKLENLRRLYSFPSPRVRVRSEALNQGYDGYEEDEFFDEVPPYIADVDGTDAVDYTEDISGGVNYTNLVFFDGKWTKNFISGYAAAADMTIEAENRALLAALMTVEFTEQEPKLNIDTEKPIFVASMEDMAVVAFDSDQGYVHIFLQLDPMAICYGFINTHDPDYMLVDLESTSDMVWQVTEDEYYEALIALATQLAE